MSGPTPRARGRLLVFARLPEPGRTKTRLAPLLGPHGAAQLYRAFLDDTIAVARRVGGVDLELWVEPREGADRWFAERHGDLMLRYQPDGDLGARLEAAFADAFADGADRAIALGSDHPTLPASYLARGFSTLRVLDLVLGPSPDGGYYAIGLHRRAWSRAPALFRGVPWSTSRVLRHTRECATGLGLSRVELPEWYDVDEPEVLERLSGDLAPDSHTARALAHVLADRT